MINKDRIVPIVKTDLLSAYGTMLTLGAMLSSVGFSYDILKSSDIPGNFSVTGSGGAGNFLCDQPVKSLDIPADVTDCMVFFVADYDFGGLTVAGAAPTFGEGYTNDTILPDCATLYSAFLTSGTVTVTAVTPVSE